MQRSASSVFSNVHARNIQEINSNASRSSSSSSAEGYSELFVHHSRVNVTHRTQRTSYFHHIPDNVNPLGKAPLAEATELFHRHTQQQQSNNQRRQVTSVSRGTATPTESNDSYHGILPGASRRVQTTHHHAPEEKAVRLMMPFRGKHNQVL